MAGLALINHPDSSDKLGCRASAVQRSIIQYAKPGTTKAKPARAERLADKGLTHGEIATALGVSRRTVIRYLQSG